MKRFEAAGWAACRIDGHDPDAILKAIEAAKMSDKPSLIACKTIIGYGAPTRAGTAKAHGEPLGKDEIEGCRKALGWTSEPFVVPADILAAWRAAGSRGAAAHADWKARLAKMDEFKKFEFERRLTGDLPFSLKAVVNHFKKAMVDEPKELATRKASEECLKVICPVVPELITGSADLTGSNNNKVAATPAISPGNYAGRFVHWGIREHGMAAAINGMALHGGLIPSGATFMVFTDYCRPALRLAALMGVRHIEVMTHDSIGLGEDGPTHQPVEHLAALRAIPNMKVFRPADATETMECWQLALESRNGPAILALTRQNLPAVRLTYEDGNLCRQGAYELRPADGVAKATIFASGSEIAIAIAAQKALSARGVPVRVVSVPCLDVFLKQDAAVKAKVIGDAPVKVAVEAGIRMGWDQVIGADGIFVGMDSFGASAPYQKLYEHFGITPAAVEAAVLARLA